VGVAGVKIFFFSVLSFFLLAIWFCRRLVCVWGFSSCLSVFSKTFCMMYTNRRDRWDGEIFSKKNYRQERKLKLPDT
jgi:hypothetical protein